MGGQETAVPGRQRVLIVDDAEDARILYAEVLGRAYDCETARDGREALDVLRGGGFDAVVLDLTMPVMDGWQVLGVLRSEDGLRDVPTIVLSADFDEETELRARRLGAVAYVAKPVDHDDLVHVVDEAVDRSG